LFILGVIKSGNQTTNPKSISTSSTVKSLTKKLGAISQLDGGGPGMSDASSESDIDDDDDPLERYATFEDDKNEGDEVSLFKLH
jgi:hypothetical protein